MVLISGSMHIGYLTGILVSAELYIAGGWLLTGFLIAIFDVVLMFALPVVGKFHRKISKITVLNKVEPTEVESKDGLTLKDRPSKLQQLAFFVPDIAVFLNNLTYILLVYTIPPRFEKFSEKSLSTAVLFSSLLIVFSFVASIGLALVTGTKMRTDVAMLIGNAVFYAGAILAFGSTTEFLAFPGSYEIGSLLVGIGDAGVVNLAIMSKFSLYEKWGVKTDNLGERSTALYNFAMATSNAAGTVLGGLTITRASEIPTICGALAACFVNTVGFSLCILVK